VKTVMLPALQRELLEERLPDEKIKELETHWKDRLFQHGKIDAILEKFKVCLNVFINNVCFQKYLNAEVLVIPSDFVQPEDEENDILKIKNEADVENELLDRVQKKRARIIQLRIEVETLRKLCGLQ
jgi:hypothetical protein